ncbi:glycerate dehydrogenase [Oscillatoria sp. FACHB-1407]|uniref:2-hydroxyacid dehydrogenase n=1 Tax=Oscillatoria sp. FACHB-1407 TaxID=2692847 RepID=UPI0016852DDC|nr:NAD(P)-dependent oxidoreductase [Oscillatoria sp. FACHB-1407]MBD2461998.1 glycerate dehydrogenase [Oscillatoria sp. FACHB-1407]
MKLVFPDYLELLDEDWQALNRLGEVTRYDDIPASETELIQRIQGAELIGTAVVAITPSVIQQCPHLRYIVVPGIGYNHVDVAAATEAGIQVMNCPTNNVLAVAEFTLGLMFAITRRIVTAHGLLTQGIWDFKPLQGVELSGKKLGLIGHGAIAQAVEQRAIALGMTVTYATSKTSPEQLDRLLAESDIVSLHLPLTPQSKYLLDERRLRLMKPTAYLINTARGAIVDPKALLTVLQEKRIAGAALDVFEQEPTDGTTSPEIQALAQLDNVVLTPHIAYNSQEALARLGQEILQAIAACLKGDPINVVNAISKKDKR